MVRFAFAAPAAFLIFLRAAARCLSVAIAFERLALLFTSNGGSFCRARTIACAALFGRRVPLARQRAMGRGRARLTFQCLLRRPRACRRRLRPRTLRLCQLARGLLPCPLGGLPFFQAAASFTPARRAFESPIAIACFAEAAPCFPSRMCSISSRTNSPAWVEGDLPSSLSLRARPIVSFVPA